MVRKLIDKLKAAFIERIFSYDECLIDSLMRIDEGEKRVCVNIAVTVIGI